MSLQIVEKSGEGLSRIYGITVPAKDLNDKLDKRIAEITPKMSLKGFRPGKVPPAHVRRMYGKELMSEVLQEAWELVEHGMINEENFKEFVFANPVRLHTAMNPDFFTGTVVEGAVSKYLGR